MSRVAPQAHEPVVPEKRRAFRAADIDAQLFLQNGLCWDCGAQDQKLEADHDLPRDLGGKTNLDNLVMRCKLCHSSKTTGRDRPMIDKARRIRNQSLEKPKRPIHNKGFDPSRTRGLNGKVRMK